MDDSSSCLTPPSRNGALPLLRLLRSISLSRSSLSLLLERLPGAEHDVALLRHLLGPQRIPLHRVAKFQMILHAEDHNRLTKSCFDNRALWQSNAPGTVHLEAS